MTIVETKTEQEAANIKLVRAFLDSWLEPDKAASYIADDAVLRMEDGKPPAVGGKAFSDAMKKFLQNGLSISIDNLDVFARGKVVVTHRIDYVKSKGKPDLPHDLVGIFVVKHGKIVEWSDFLNK